jgi:nucleoside 2-deoxyribosyltransferase
MNKLTIYTVGAITGLSYQECVAHFNKRVKRLEKMDFKVFTPMLGKAHLRNEKELKPMGYEGEPISTNHAIVQADFWRVDNSDIILVDFTNAANRVSIGSVAEMSRAFAKDKLIITVMGDINVHQHCFILEMSSIIFKTNEDAYKYLEHFKKINS